MKAGIITDTHDAMPRFEKGVDILSRKGCSILFHCGDFVSPFAFRILSGFQGPVFTVFGNNEGEKGMIYDIANQFDHIVLENEILTVKMGGKRFLIKHRPEGVEHYAHSGDFDYIFYGHTHKIDIRDINGTRIINPGEACGYITGRSTAAVLNTTDNDVQIIDIP